MLLLQRDICCGEDGARLHHHTDKAQTMKPNTIPLIRLQLAALFKLYVSVTRVRAGCRYLGMDETAEVEKLTLIRAAMRKYVCALRTGIPCPFQAIGRQP
jgi:hypothetical protein